MKGGVLFTLSSYYSLEKVLMLFILNLMKFSMKRSFYLPLSFFFLPNFVHLTFYFGTNSSSRMMISHRP